MKIMAVSYFSQTPDETHVTSEKKKKIQKVN